MIELRKVSETNTTITLGWDPVPGAAGFRFIVDGKVSHTWDPFRTTVKVSKVASRVMVEAVGVTDSGVWPTQPPPPTGVLRWKPPGWNGGDPRDPASYPGYTKITANLGAQRLDLNNGTDYVVVVGAKVWSSGTGRTIGLHINGGRNVVIVGGSLVFTGTNSADDAIGILVDVGADGGIVHLEGLSISAPNPVTVRSRRAVQIEACRLPASTYQDNYSNIHPDLVQVWGTSTGPGGHTPCAAIRMNRVTGLTTYTGLVCLVEISPGAAGGQTDPLRWERYEVDLHPVPGKDAGNFAYHCSGPTGQAGGPYCEYLGEVYAELPTGGGGAYTRPIDGIVCLRYITSPLSVFPYEIHRPDGTTVYTSPDAPTGGNGPLAETTRAGNYLTFAREPKLAKQRWIIGKPPGGEFVPAAMVGPSYVPLGYA